MNKTTSSWINGSLGVLIFSGSLPATRAAVADFDPVFLTVARATLAAVLAATVLIAARQSRPERRDIVSLLVVAAGVVVGFPLLTALALRQMTSAHSIVFLGLLPLATAFFAVMRGGERPRLAFWLFSGLGALVVTGFTWREGAGVALGGASLMLAAVTVCGLGYAEGAVLSRRLGGWQVISWALIAAAPLMLPLAFVMMPASLHAIRESAWLGLLYVSVFSMFIGFVFWYRGLAAGGISAVGQLQLLQPLLGLMVAALVLGESVSHAMLMTTIAVVFCVAGARRFAS